MQVEGHPAFGRGTVRAARINELLGNGSWSWCGIATFYIVVAVLGITTLYVLHWTGVVDGISKVAGWILATLVPGGLTLLKLLLEVQNLDPINGMCPTAPCKAGQGKLFSASYTAIFSLLQGCCNYLSSVHVPTSAETKQCLFAMNCGGADFH